MFLVALSTGHPDESMLGFARLIVRFAQFVQAPTLNSMLDEPCCLCGSACDAELEDTGVAEIHGVNQ